MIHISIVNNGVLKINMITLTVDLWLPEGHEKLVKKGLDKINQSV